MVQDVVISYFRPPLPLNDNFVAGLWMGWHHIALSSTSLTGGDALWSFCMHASKISNQHLVLTVRRRRFVVGLEKIRCRFPLPPPTHLHTGRGPDEVDCTLSLWGIHHSRQSCPTFNFCIGLLSSTMTPRESHFAIATSKHVYSSSGCKITA